MREHKRLNFTKYMQVGVDKLSGLPQGSRILDMPAGSARVTDALREKGYRVTSADINAYRDDYVYADMNRTLPFADQSFDGAICLEGIEHTLQPNVLISELIRVTRVGGRIVLSTPNIMNMYSRLQFLATGTFHQFEPAVMPIVQRGEMADRFHIAPLTFHTMRYQADYFGAKVVDVAGDTAKKRWLMPFYLAVLAIGWPWRKKAYQGVNDEQRLARNAEIERYAQSWSALLSRSIIMVFEKVRHESSILDEITGPAPA
ncbi:MAG: class I SAM-dependent methyltransferase, partial [Planctomycetales bacterium]|nr:class I SAM-dependent methyltransferase [Planctomycetales bacterium]